MFIQGVADNTIPHQDSAPPSPADQMRLGQPVRPIHSVISSPASGMTCRASTKSRSPCSATMRTSVGAAFEQADAADAKVTTGERDWLSRLLDRNSARDELEQALIDALAEDGIRPFGADSLLVRRFVSAYAAFRNRGRAHENPFFPDRLRAAARGMQQGPQVKEKNGASPRSPRKCRAESRDDTSCGAGCGNPRSPSRNSKFRACPPECRSA